MSILLAALLAMGGVNGADADADKATDFAVREVTPSLTAAPQPMIGAVLAFDMASAKYVGGQWGTVTSTYRSPAHNRRVGGVANSYHLRNRAIDIARRPGVRHRDVDAAYRKAGFRLIESLDEGDHSHFAFADGAAAPAKPIATIQGSQSKPTEWRIVFAPKSAN